MRVAGTTRRTTARGRPRKLTRDEVAAGALTVLDRDGIDGLSNAAAAAELGISTATLYNSYARTKDELINLAADSVLAQVPTQDPDRPWSDEAARICHSIYQLLIDHPAVPQIIAGRTIMGPGTARTMETLLSVLDRGGLHGEHLVAAYRSLLAFILGSSLLYTSHAQDPDTEKARREQQRALSPTDYPTIHEAWTHLTAPTRPQQFEQGLKDILDRFTTGLSR